GAAEVADDAADVSRDARKPLRSQDQQRDDQHEDQLLGADAEHQRRSTAATRAAFAASRSARAADAAAGSKSAPDDAYVMDRDADGRTPPPRASSAARMAVATSPPWLPTPGMRKRRSGASSRIRRASSGYVAPTTKPHVSAANDATVRSTRRSYSGRPSTIRSWTSPAPGLLVRASTSAYRPSRQNGSMLSIPTYGATVAASAWNESNSASAYAAEVFGTSPRLASSTTGISSGIAWSVRPSTSKAALP